MLEEKIGNVINALREARELLEKDKKDVESQKESLSDYKANLANIATDLSKKESDLSGREMALLKAKKEYDFSVSVDDKIAELNQAKLDFDLFKSKELDAMDILKQEYVSGIECHTIEKKALVKERDALKSKLDAMKKAMKG